MADFAELLKPTFDVGNEKWFVAAGRSLYLTTTGTTVSKTPLDHLYFDTERAAWNASLVYYTNHGKLYPYREEYNQMITRSDPSSDNAVVKSEVMQFE